MVPRRVVRRENASGIAILRATKTKHGDRKQLVNYLWNR